MSFLTAKQLTIADSPNLDAFGRLRTSDPVGMFNSQLQYGKEPLVWEEVIAGAASSAHVPNESCVTMSTTTASGDAVTRQSREYIRYQPGKSQMLLATLVMGTVATNTVIEVGLGDSQNGLFLIRDGSTYKFVVRSYTTGSAVDEEVEQANWDDPMDGSGRSGITLDFSKAQILVIDLEWLGVGRVRFGFVVDGKIYYAYDALHTNNGLAKVYMTTANLPIRYKIYNKALASTTSSLKQICCSVASEGGFDVDRAFSRGISNVAVVSCGTGLTPVLAIRPRLTFNSITNRSILIPDVIDIVGSADGYWQLLYSPTWTGGSWTNVDATHSSTEYSLNATITGGVPIAAGLIAGTAQNRTSVSRLLNGRARGLLDIAGTTQYGFILVAAALTGTINVRAALTWFELR